MDRSLYKGLAISNRIGSYTFPWQRTMGGHLLSQGRAFVPCYLGLFWAILRFGLHLRQMLGSTTVSWIWVPLAGLTFSFLLALFAISPSLSVQRIDPIGPWTSCFPEILWRLTHSANRILPELLLCRSDLHRTLCAHRQWKNTQIIIKSLGFRELWQGKLKSVSGKEDRECEGEEKERQIYLCT